MATQTYSQVYTQTHSITFLSDNFRNTLREVIRENGLSPDKLMQEWSVIEAGIKAWLQSKHLIEVVVEFFKPGATFASARWDFPVGYSGSGVDDDMWLDKAYLKQLIAKAARPSSDCVYRILLRTANGAPYVSGFADAAFLSTGSLAARHSGTVLATGHLTASATYWR